MVSSAITVTVKQFPWVCCCLVALCLSVNKSANHDAALHSNTQAMDCKATHRTLQRNLIYRSNSTSPYCLVMVFLSSSSAPPWRVTLACHHHYFIDKTFMTQPKIQKRSAATATLPPHETRIKKNINASKNIQHASKKIKMHQKKYPDATVWDLLSLVLQT